LYVFLTAKSLPNHCQLLPKCAKNGYIFHITKKIRLAVVGSDLAVIWQLKIVVNI
jgi:hypothetical protein